MAFNIYDTHTLLMAVESLSPVSSFLRDRYFPTNEATDVFSTTDVLVEYKDGNKKLAPFVAPRKGGVTILRKGYTVDRYTPPRIAPKRALLPKQADLRRVYSHPFALGIQFLPQYRHLSVSSNNFVYSRKVFHHIEPCSLGQIILPQTD